MLVPIEWEEPFGLVMVEAMASGTPPVALRRGSVPEVIDHGRTGLIADDVDGMVAAIEEVGALDPLELRREAAERFSPDRMIDAHLAAYQRLLSEDTAAPVRLATAG